MVVCVQCVHHIALEEDDSPRYDCWYSHVCGARPLGKFLDHVTGKMLSVTGNDYMYCRDINRSGLCGFFKEEAGV